MTMDKNLSTRKSLELFIFHMKLARYTLDIYLFALQSSKIVRCLIKLHLKSVRIRVILDPAYKDILKKYVYKMRRNGIALKWKLEDSIAPRRIMLLDARPDERYRNFRITPMAIVTANSPNHCHIVDNVRHAGIYCIPERVQSLHEEFEAAWNEIPDNE